MRNITVGYIKPEKESFISNIIINNNFLDALSHYIKVVTITTDSKKIDLRNLEDLNIDYLLADIKNFGPMQFILREKQQVNIPFIIMLHSVYFWFESLVYIVPLIRKEDIIIAPSEYAKNSFLKVATNLKIYIIPHCLDIKQIQVNIPPFNFKFDNKKQICFMGRLTKEKGIDILIDCLPGIISKITDVHLNIIGPLSGAGITNLPKSPYVKKLERKIRKLGLTNNVHFMGLKLGWEKYKILSESDIFVSSTTTRETFNVSCLEALACGVPVITTDLGISKELIREGKNGYLLKTTGAGNGKLRFDKKYLISLIVKVLKNKKLNLRLKQNAMKSARKFDYHKVITKLVRLLKKRIKFKIKNKWKIIKNKKVTDFSHFFNKEFLFFLCYSYRFRTETYASLYKRMSKSISFENKYYLNRRRIIKMKNNKNIKVVDKIRRNFLDFLLLKCD